MAATIADLKRQKHFNDNLLSITVDSTVAQAAQLMSAHNVGCLVVFDREKRFAGILSERDVLGKICAGNIIPDTVKVGSIMTTSVITCSLDTEITEAEAIMAEHHIRHLPILNKKQPIGMISNRDTIAYRMGISKAMQMAAEELAILSANLRSLEIEDVVAMAIYDVPEIFVSERASICFKEKSQAPLSVYQAKCKCADKIFSEYITDEHQPETPLILTSQTCSGCGDSSEKICKIVVPLFINNDAIDKSEKSASGVLCMCRPDSLAVNDDQTEFYKANILQQILSANLTNALLYTNYKEARLNSEIDPLTGVGTRRILENALKTECARAQRYGRTFSVAIADLDYFKKINDTAGHAIGDETLKELARLMSNTGRDTDVIVARYGGDEFVVIMPETKELGAKIVMERIRQKFNNLSVPGIDSLSISCGVAEWSPGLSDTAESIMKRADACLYEAKKRGRNCVVDASELLVAKV